MLINEKFVIKINNKNFGYFSNIMENIQYGNTYSVNTELLHPGTKQNVKIICDNCGEITINNYCEYYKIIKNRGKYYCKKCNNIHRKETNMVKYGVEHISKTDWFKEKSKKTCLEKYGVESFSKTEEDKERKRKLTYLNSEEFLLKSKNTKLNKYGNENYVNFEKIKETRLEKYGDENYNNRLKAKETCLEKYGVDNISKSPLIKLKKINTCISNYGVEHQLKSEVIINKLKETNNEKYGTDWGFSNTEIIEKSKNTRINKGNQIPDNLLNEFNFYMKKCLSITLKCRKELFNNWNGYDYYDKEYIKDNLKLNSNNKLYPTVDHMISIYEGFNKGIEPEIIGNINNLCITKRTINSSKNNKSIL